MKNEENLTITLLIFAFCLVFSCWLPLVDCCSSHSFSLHLQSYVYDVPSIFCLIHLHGSPTQSILNTKSQVIQASLCYCQIFTCTRISKANVTTSGLREPYIHRWCEGGKYANWERELTLEIICCCCCRRRRLSGVCFFSQLSLNTWMLQSELGCTNEQPTMIPVSSRVKSIVDWRTVGIRR